jgi:4a-hydroxytetrahydrobiopterin dehydratase
MSAVSPDGGHAGPRRLDAEEIRAALGNLQPGWGLNAAGRLERRYAFPDFRQALAFANRLGALADAAGHHPDLHLGWGRCTVEIWTHSAAGLTPLDFALAAQADRASLDSPPLAPSGGSA